MDLSLLIPVYNTAKWLPECLDSILSQNLASYQVEIIIVNDGSTDESHIVINRYLEKYPDIILINQVNKGLSSARNIALKKAKGKFILFIDSDDYLYPDSLLPLLTKAYALNSDLLSFAAYSVYPNLKEKRFNTDVLSGFENIKGITYLHKINLIGGVCRILFSRNFLLKNNLFMYDGIFCEDELFLPQAFSQAECVSVTDIKTYAYRRREGSITTLLSEPHKTKLLQDRLFVLGELSKYSKASCVEVQEALEYKISLLTIDVILHLYKDGYSISQRKEVVEKLLLNGFLPLKKLDRSLKYRIVRGLINSRSLFNIFKRIIPKLDI